jgi:hypothetical protein
VDAHLVEQARPEQLPNTRVLPDERGPHGRITWSPRGRDGKN